MPPLDAQTAHVAQVDGPANEQPLKALMIVRASERKRIVFGIMYCTFVFCWFIYYVWSRVEP